MNWFNFGGIVLPLIYLSFIGWAHKNLIETNRYDFIATTLCVASMFVCAYIGIEKFDKQICEQYKEFYLKSKIDYQKKEDKFGVVK
jgi:hypothetical protein